VAGEDGAIPSALVCLCILPLALLGDVVIGDIIEEVDILVFLVTFRGLYMYTGVAVALWMLRSEDIERDRITRRLTTIGAHTQSTESASPASAAPTTSSLVKLKEVFSVVRGLLFALSNIPRLLVTSQERAKASVELVSPSTSSRIDSCSSCASIPGSHSTGSHSIPGSHADTLLTAGSVSSSQYIWFDKADEDADVPGALLTPLQSVLSPGIMVFERVDVNAVMKKDVSLLRMVLRLYSVSASDSFSPSLVEGAEDSELRPVPPGEALLPSSTSSAPLSLDRSLLPLRSPRST
jgi:hypothetical protein